MNLSPFVISQIRTYVPVAVGALLTWLASSLKIVIDPSSQTALVALCTAVLSAVYYLLVRVLEKWQPKLGVFLGVAAKPAYPAVAAPEVK